MTSSLALLDYLADRGWPALEREALEGWTMRFSNGVTHRANSVLPAGSVADVRSAVDSAERAYRSRGLPPVFQVSDAVARDLPEELARRGYTSHSKTQIMTADLPLLGSLQDVRGAARISDDPGSSWADLWWSVDGRGGDDELAVALRIMRGGRALYGSLTSPQFGDGFAPAAVARLALVNEWAGLFAVATHPAARRRGYARRLILSLCAAARAEGASGVWLQVMADNAGARRLYSGMGFIDVSSYEYWSVPEPARRRIR